MVVAQPGCFSKMPFYQYNPFTGRLKESNYLQPLFPISAIPLQKADPPKVMYNTSTIKHTNVKPINAKPASNQAPVKVGGRVIEPVTDDPTSIYYLPEKIIKQRKMFQTNMHEPVYLKAGARDKVLFGITLLLTGYCLFDSVKFMWECRNE